MSGNIEDLFCLEDMVGGSSWLGTAVRIKDPDRILGIDPSSVSTGVAILCKTAERKIELEHYEAIKLKGDLSDRVGTLFERLLKIIESTNVSMIAFETPFVGRNIATYGKLSMLRGVVYVLAWQYNIRLVELPPSKVKQLVASKGGATKEEIAEVVRKLHPGLPEDISNDITDAIAVAHAGLIESNYWDSYEESKKAEEKKNK